MKSKLLGGASLALTALVLSACSNTSKEQQVAYQGLYEIFTDGSCQLINGERSDKNMLLRVDELKEGEGYDAKLPSFMNTVIPWMSNPATSDNEGLTLQFDNPGPVEVDDGKQAQINVTLRMKQHPTEADRVLITEFNLSKVIDGKLENRDFVQWYLEKLSDSERANISGLCAMDVSGLAKPRPSLKLFQQAIEVDKPEAKG